MPYRSAPLQGPVVARWRLPRLVVVAACVMAVAVGERGAARTMHPRASTARDGGGAIESARPVTMIGGERLTILQGEGANATVVRLPGHEVRRGTDVFLVPEVMPLRDAVTPIAGAPWALYAEIPGHGRVVRLRRPDLCRSPAEPIASSQREHETQVASSVALLSDGTVAVGDRALSAGPAEVWRHLVEVAEPNDCVELRPNGDIHGVVESWNINDDEDLGFDTALLRVPEPVEVAYSRGRMACVRGRRGDVRCGDVVEVGGGCIDPHYVDVWALGAVTDARAARVVVNDRDLCVIDFDGRLSCARVPELRDAELRPREKESPIVLSPVAGVGRVTEVALAPGLRCARQVTGAVVCDGDALTANPVVRRDVPVELADFDDATRLLAFGPLVCALQRGTLSCWGGSPSPRDPPIGHPQPVRTTGAITELAQRGDEYHRELCALTSDGAMECWGADPFHDRSFVRRTNLGPLHSFANVGGLFCALDRQARAWCHPPHNAPPQSLARAPMLDGFERAIEDGGIACATRGDELRCLPAMCELGPFGRCMDDAVWWRERAEIVRHLPRTAPAPGAYAQSMLAAWPADDERADSAFAAVSAVLRVAVRPTPVSRSAHFCALGVDGRVACLWQSPAPIDERSANAPRRASTASVVPGLDDAVELAVTTDGLACARRRSGRIACWGRNVGGVLTLGEAPRGAPPYRLDELLAR